MNEPQKLSFQTAQKDWEVTSTWIESVLTYAETSTGDKAASKSVDLVKKIMLGYLDHGWLIHTRDKLEKAVTVEDLKNIITSELEVWWPDRRRKILFFELRGRMESSPESF